MQGEKNRQRDEALVSSEWGEENLKTGKDRCGACQGPIHKEGINMEVGVKGGRTVPPLWGMHRRLANRQMKSASGGTRKKNDRTEKGRKGTHPYLQ